MRRWGIWGIISIVDREALAKLSLLELVPALSPEFGRPWHMQPWIDLLEAAARGEAVRGLCALPIRHFKSETSFHGVIHVLLKDPTARVIFLTHSQERTNVVGKRIRDLAREAGVGPTKGADLIAQWSNEWGGGVVTMSAGQSRLGYDCHVLLADDPLDEDGADDPRVREAVDHTLAHYQARCMRRGKPGPVLVVMSRWHVDDPIGRRLIRTARQWTYVHQPAIVDEGLETERAFAPDVWPLEELRIMRAELREADPTERLWWAQLMGEPRPLGSDMFGSATYYEQLPTWAGWRVGSGVDFAFTSNEGSDWFARVVGRAYGGKLYLLDVSRDKIDAHRIESALKADQNKHGRHLVFSYQSGPEVGLSRVMQERGVPLARMHARYSKWVRAQRTIARWNAGDILVPSGATWVAGFLHRLSYFRGSEKASDDDEVDALVSLADGMLGGAVTGGIKTLGRAYGGFV